MAGNLPVAAFGKAAHHARVHGGAAVAAQVRGDTGNEAVVGIGLGGIPHHDTTEAGEGGRVVNDGLKVGSRQVSGAGSTSVGRNTKDDLDIRVLGGVLGPLVPLVEVEGSLCVGSGLVVLNTAEVVVELDPDSIEGNSTVQHGVVSSVRVDTLRSGSQEVFLASVGIHKVANLVAEDLHVRNSGLKVKVKSINNGIAEWTVGRAVLVGTESFPDQLSASGGGIRAGEASFAVGGTTNGKKNGLSLVLAGFDVGTTRCNISCYSV